MVLDQLAGCETTLNACLLIISRGNRLFSSFISDQEEENKKSLSAFPVEALLPMGQANVHSIISPVLNRCWFCSWITGSQDTRG